MTIKIVNGRVVRDRLCAGQSVYLKNGKILAVTGEELPFDRVVDAEGCFVAPGFIDLHVHGGGGADFMDGGVEPVVTAAAAHLAHGTTTLFPTTLASSFSVLRESLLDVRMAAALSADPSGPRLPHIPGAHLEGPYFSPAQAGAQNPAYITPPVPADYGAILEEFGPFIRRWSYAPELPGADEFLDALNANGTVPAVGHSDAAYPDVKRACDRGCRLATHLYSGMSTITRRGGYRVPGVLESAYLLDEMDVELIADGCHLPAELLRLAVKVKGPHRVCLITDAMRGAGMPEGPSMLGRKSECTPCVIEDGVAKMTDRSGFAGSVATADRLVRTMVNAGVSLTDAVTMMTATPARVMGLSRKGRLEPGFDADVVLFDEDVRIRQVLLSGDSEG